MSAIVSAREPPRKQHRAALDVARGNGTEEDEGEFRRIAVEIGKRRAERQLGGLVRR